MQKNCLGYPVEFVDDIFGSSSVLAGTVRKVTGSENPGVVLIADLNVVQQTEGLGTKIGNYLQANGMKLLTRPVIVVGGEKTKVEYASHVTNVFGAVAAMPASGGCLLALGGGTLFDIAGYVAAQVGCGLKTVRIPTTPAAMIDAAFSEYSAVNLSGVKDALRVPYRPSAVLIDTAFSSTVLDGVWRGGFSEAVRVAAVKDSSLLKLLGETLADYAKRNLEALRKIVTAAVAVRMKKGSSAFGLWAAERMEEMSGFKLPHGYSIAIGMCLDSAYAIDKGLLKEKDRDTLVRMLGDAGILDGVRHSRHLMKDVEAVLSGLDRWQRMTGSLALTIPVGAGKSRDEEAPDRGAYAAILKKYADLSPES